MHDTTRSYRDVYDSAVAVYPPEDFEGLWTEHSSAGQLTYRGEFKKGRMRIGQHISFWDSGLLREISVWDEGWVCGTLISFYEEGSKQFEKDFGEYGGRIRCWTERSYGFGNGQLMSVTVWKDGHILAEWVNPESRRIWKEIDGDKIVAESFARFIDNPNLKTTADVEAEARRASFRVTKSDGEDNSA
jgi:hypothetical protein